MDDNIFTLAKAQAERLGVRNVLVATNTGASVELAREVFGEGFRLFAVGNPASSHEKGLVLHRGISEETKQGLEGLGITVVLWEVSAFADLPTNSIFHNANRAFVDRFGRTYRDDQTVPDNVCKVLVHTLSEFFGDGPRVCMEITLMAADSGLLPLDQDCVAITRPLGYSHAAVILHPVTSNELFLTAFRVKDLILAPADDDIWFNGGPIP